MGLLTQVLTQKLAQHHQDEMIARNNRIQANLGLAHANFPLDEDPGKDAQLRQYYADLATKDMSPDAKKTYQRGSALMGFFHNVLGHRDPQQPQQASPANALQAPSVPRATGPSPDAQSIGQTPSGTVDQNPGIDIGAGSGPTAQPAQPLQRPTAPPSQNPAPQSTFNPAAANPFGGYNPEVQAQNANRINKAKATALGFKPGTAAYDEVAATGGPSTVITEKAKLEAGREVGASILNDLEQRGIQIPDTVKAEILANKNLGLGMMMRPVFSPRPVSGKELPPGATDMFGNPKDDAKDYVVRMDGVGNREYIPAEIAQRFMQTVGGGMGGVNPMHPGETPTAVPGAVAPSQNRVVTSDLAGGGKGAETAGQALAGAPPTPIPGTLGQGNAVNTTRETAGVDAGGNPVTIPLKSQRTRGGAPAGTGNKVGTGANGAAPGSPMSGGNAPAPSGGVPSSRALPGMTPGTFNSSVQRAIPVREAATQIFGDPSQPDVKALRDYSTLADDEGAQQRLGKALRLTFDGLKQATGGASISAGAGPISVSTGGIGELLQNAFGVRPELASQQTQIMKDAMDAMKGHPAELEAYSAIMSAFASSVGLRSLSRASAAQSSVETIERELPVIGVNTFSSKQFNDQLGHLSVLIGNASKNMPASMLDPKLVDRVRNFQSSPAAKASPKSELKSPNDLKSKSTDELLKMLK